MGSEKVVFHLHKDLQKQKVKHKIFTFHPMLMLFFHDVEKRGTITHRQPDDGFLHQSNDNFTRSQGRLPDGRGE